MPFYPIPLYASFAVLINELGASFGRDAEPVFREAEENLERASRLFPRYDCHAEIRNIFDPYTRYFLETHIHYTKNNIPEPKTGEDHDFLARLLEYHLGKAAVESGNKPSAEKDFFWRTTMVGWVHENPEDRWGNQQSKLTLILQPEAMACLLDMCEKHEGHNHILESVEATFRRTTPKIINGIVATMHEYKGFGKTPEEVITLDDMTGSIPLRHRLSGLGKTRKYAESLCSERS